MQIKYYDDVLMVECDKFRYAKYFESIKGKWVDIKGKNHFAVGKENEAELQKVLEEIKKVDEEPHDKNIKKYHNSKLKEKVEYYKSFNSKPINFTNLKVDDGDKKSPVHSLSSSSYGDDDESSDGFPSPNTPGKKEEEEEEDGDFEDDLEYIFQKLEELEKRLERLESKKKL